MRDIIVDTVKGAKLERLYEVSELSYMRKMMECRESRKRGISYLEIPCAFDIETTNIYNLDETGNIDTSARPYAYMYHWQFCLDDEVCFGRTWKEFRHLLRCLESNMNLNQNNRLVVYVHNLPFEMQFMRRFINVIDSFCKEPYKPLKIVTDGGIEFRDSYSLSNMSLGKFCENEKGVEHYKLSGDDFNYRRIRTAQTRLTENEEAYCYNDVRGLCECIRSRMEEDTLASIPLTSTGYVRRKCRNAMRQNRRNRERFKETRLTPDLYTMCREAFRGGDTHANLRHADQILYGVHSYDISSSYPWQMLKKYPCGKFTKITLNSFLNRDLSEFALLFRVRLKNPKYIGKCGIPYISRSKCTLCDSDAVIDNGRILYVNGIAEMTVTDIDWKIILNEYSFEDYWIKDIYASKYDYMPKEFRDVVMDYYRKKTELKGIKDKIYEYNKSKNQLNGLYGMQVMRIDQTLCKYIDGEYKEEEAELSDLLDRYYKSRNNFLSYQQGLFVTCHARKQLRDMLNIVGRDVVYCDTDSIKYLGDHKADFEKANAEIIRDAEEKGAFAYDAKGRKRYLGIWDYEGEYEEFKTLGAKKYVYKEDGQYYSTIAGIAKKAGAEFFNRHGIEAFKNGTAIKESGHLTAFYNDDEIHEIEIDGCRMETASNVALLDNTYTIGMTAEYLDLLEKALDNQTELFYI